MGSIYFALAMISAYCLNKSPEDSGLSVKKQNKIRRIKFLIIVAIVVLGGVTIQRHKLSGTIFASILNVVAGYFCCGPALLQVMMKDPVALGYPFGIGDNQYLADCSVVLVV